MSSATLVKQSDDLLWCLECRAERLAEVLHLQDEPEPVVVCTACGVVLDV
ncbi:hypothetical protein EV193_1011080 [Herbihabitans rhizosphaerae]|uniref:Small CPxCG-related zinc finger protein n=1 Tax=Herbihabitans rhizosphaerae TaxID=1872711 RepID=A0A4V2EUN5_9PSEU|nr:hypothetical protein [Herbihabitans rhizosphaerae]RZS45193.1 hypothetical protein EV193_1011080 [Herbihabitans rhizosphaerae]